MAVDSKPCTRCESSNDSDGDGDHRVEPRKHREGEDTWRNSAKSCIEVVILDCVFEDAEAIVVALDTELRHCGCLLRMSLFGKRAGRLTGCGYSEGI